MYTKRKWGNRHLSYLSKIFKLCWRDLMRTDIVCSAHDGGFFLQRPRQKQLMTGYFHVPYHGSISERCRWARQSTTRPCSLEQSFIWFTISLLLVLGRGDESLVVHAFRPPWKKKKKKKKEGGWLIDNSCFIQKEVCVLWRAHKYGSG